MTFPLARGLSKIAPGTIPVNLSTPVASGTVNQGQVVSTTNGTWTNTPTGYTYQWQRDNQGDLAPMNIAGATASSYTLTAADTRCHVRCVVQATNASGSAYAGSTVLGPVIGIPANTTAPVASGAAVTTTAVVTTDGVWTGPPFAFGYQWQRDAAGNFVYSNIANALSNTYQLAPADQTCHVRCVVTGINPAGSAAANSNALGPVT